MIIKKIIKKITPPIFIDVMRYFKKNKKQCIYWGGDYESWALAKQACEGYDTDVILNQCKNALLSVKNGEKVYERDGFVFDEITYSWPLLATLQRVALENNGELCVIDFGGSLGSSYYQNKDFLKTLKHLKWCIVEQPHFVECGKLYFQNEQLHFYDSVEDCLKENKPHILLLSSVLPYLENPIDWINKFIALNLSYIVIDRTGFIDGPSTILTIQKTNLPFYRASYPAYFFALNRFINYFLENYTLISQFDNGITPAIELNGKKAFWNGLILKKND